LDLKKYLIIIFSFFYLIASSGTTFNLHYCGGKLKSVSFFKADEKSCCGKKMKSKGCCKDKATTVKIKDNFKTNISVKAPSNNYKLNAVLPDIVIIHIKENFQHKFVSYFNFQPVVCDNFLYLKNRILLI